MNDDQPEVRHNAAARRFEIPLGNQFAIVQYRMSGNTIVFTHTEVPREYEGQGYAFRLAKAALDYAVDAGYQIQPLCPLVKHYIERHPEYQPYTVGYTAQ